MGYKDTSEMKTDAPEELRQRAVLVGVGTPEDEVSVRDSLEELAALADTAGADTAAYVVQNLRSPDPATYIGSGKIEEVAQIIEETGADLVITDDELTPAQQRNLQRELSEVTVIDRTTLILDIFAAHASSGEGKLQVELAQLQYNLVRLAGRGQALSRLGGGIGTRGPGEKKLETDRRLIRKRISSLKASLEEVRRHRSVIRAHRAEGTIPVAAIVGYTNAGKSTLLNALTGAGVLAQDQLFATLDPVTRMTELPLGQQVLLTDTVGFIRKLPHHLIEAFGSTLEEAKYADVIIHVVDASGPQMGQQMQTVYETLHQLQVEGIPVLTVFNKCDNLDEPLPVLRDRNADESVCVSARAGTGLEELRESLQDLLTRNLILVERLYAYTDGSKVQLIREAGQLLSEKYTAEGIRVKAYVPPEIYGRI